MKTVVPMLALAASLLVGTLPLALADAGVFTGNGQDLHQITSKTIQLVSIDVTMVLGRGPFLYDGTVPGMDRAEYRCSFLLQNLSDNDEEVEVGFPVDSQFAKGAKPESPSESQDWVLEYGFIARDEATTYHVVFVRRKPEGGPGDLGSVFVWKMHFPAKKSRTLIVQYQIPMSMGLIPLQKQESGGSAPGVFGQEFLNIGQLDMAGYITSTGSSWAGNVEMAKVTLITEPFERYFEHRGITEEDSVGSNPEEKEQFNSTFPVRHPWWFRRIEPEGWQEVKGGVQWHYKDFKPKESIEVRYYTTPFPRLPEETDAFVDGFVKALGSKGPVAPQLVRLKQVLLAVYGCEPNDQAAKAFVSQQLWYEPRKGWPTARLNAEQRAVLQKMDRRVAAAERK